MLLVELRLQLGGHPVVAVLGVLEVESHLVHVGEGVQVLVVLHAAHLGLTELLGFDRVAQDDLLLKLVILAAKCFVLSALIKDGLNELPLHLVLVEHIVGAIIHVLHLFIIKILVLSRLHGRLARLAGGLLRRPLALLGRRLRLLLR